ncbi:unnamed protein product, partial [Trichobilharzia regenti]
LKIAKEYGDLVAQRRAHSNIGNTYIFLADFNSAVEHYRLADRIGEGRAHWSLATAYTALKRYDLALRCSRRHRQIAYEVWFFCCYIEYVFIIVVCVCL